MTKHFQDRFELDKFDNGTMVLVGLLDDGIKKDSSIEIQEPIMERIYQIGLAYKLKYCALIDIFGDLKLNELGCKAIIAELEFIQEVVDDAILKKVIPEIIGVANECINQKGKVKFIISGN